MLPVLSATAVREADAWTIEHERIPSWELVERAGSACADRIAELITGGHFGEPSKTAVLVLAGAGNNGGDGLVIARLLKQRGLDVTVFHAMHGSRSSPDNAKNLGIAIEVGVEITEIEEGAREGAYEENWVLPSGKILRVTGRPHPQGAVAFLFVLTPAAS